MTASTRACIVHNLLPTPDNQDNFAQYRPQPGSRAHQHLACSMMSYASQDSLARGDLYALEQYQRDSPLGYGILAHLFWYACCRAHKLEMSGNLLFPPIMHHCANCCGAGVATLTHERCAECSPQLPGYT